MNSKELYQRKVVSVEEALKEIKSGQEVTCGLIACEPVTMLSQLHTIKDRVENVSVVTALLMNEYEFFMNPDMEGHFLMNCWFYTGGARKAHQFGTVSYVPLELHRSASCRTSYRKPDIFLGCACPMDQHGFLSLSSVLYGKKNCWNRLTKLSLRSIPISPEPAVIL